MALQLLRCRIWVPMTFAEVVGWLALDAGLPRLRYMCRSAEMQALACVRSAPGRQVDLRVATLRSRDFDRFHAATRFQCLWLALLQSGC